MFPCSCHTIHKLNFSFCAFIVCVLNGTTNSWYAIDFNIIDFLCHYQLYLLCTCIYFFLGFFPSLCASHCCIENMAAEWEKSNSTKSIKYSGKNMAQVENSLHTSSSSRSSFMLHSHLYNDSRSGKNRGGNNMNTRRYVYIVTLCLPM